MSTLWLVEIDEADWDYDRFSRAVVWADSAEHAERVIRAEKRYDEGVGLENLWIEDPEWRLNVRPAPTEGVALVHWHAG